jgi:hypothetical protein
VKHNVEIRVASGIPPSQVKEPYRPMAFDPGSVQRPSLRALYDFKGNGIDELSFKAGDVIFVVQEEREGWYQGELNGKRGFLPATYVERMKVQKKGPTTKGNVGLRIEEKKKKKKSAWREIVSDEGEKYYYNDDTGESRWDPPAEEEEEPAQPTFQMAPEKTCAFSGCGNKPFAGGKYCVSHQNADKKTESVASGNSTKSSGGPRAQPNFGTQASSSNLTNKSSGMQSMQGSSSSAAAKKVPIPQGTGRPVVKQMPKMQPIPGKSGMQNTGMNQGQQGMGRGMGMPGMMGRGQPTGMGQQQTTSQPRMSVPKAPVPKAAPAKKKSDWIKVLDDSSGNYYYYNEKTQESVWEQPPGFY